MLTGLTREVKEKLGHTLNAVVSGAIAAAALTAAVLFLALGTFLWAERAYGAITAAFVLGGFFLLIALATWAAYFAIRRRAAERERLAAAAEAEAGKQWWLDPVVIATALQLVRTVGITRLIPIVALGAVAAEHFLGRPKAKTRTPSASAATRSGNGADRQAAASL